MSQKIFKKLAKLLAQTQTKQKIKGQEKKQPAFLRSRESFLTYSRMDQTITRQQLKEFIEATFARYAPVQYYIARQNHAQSQELEGDGIHFHVFVRCVKQPNLSLSKSLDFKGRHPNVKHGQFGRHISYLTCTTQKKPQIDTQALTNFKQSQLKFAGLDQQQFKRARHLAMMEDPSYCTEKVRNYQVDVGQVKRLRNSYNQFLQFTRQKPDYKFRSQWQLPENWYPLKKIKCWQSESIRKQRHYFIYSPPSWGKSYPFLNTYKEQCYLWNCKSQFQEYKGQPIILFDQFRPDNLIKIGMMNMLCNGNTPICCKNQKDIRLPRHVTIIILSNRQGFSQVYKDQEKVDTLNQRFIYLDLIRIGVQKYIPKYQPFDIKDLM